MTIPRVTGALLRVACVLVLTAGAAAAQGVDETKPDGREPFMVSGYFGNAIDNFAPASVGGYTDPQAGGMASRFAGGVDVEFRASGKSTSRRQLWLFGETLHGVRSADVDCGTAATDKPPVCGALSAINGQQALNHPDLLGFRSDAPDGGQRPDVLRNRIRSRRAVQAVESASFRRP